MTPLEFSFEPPARVWSINERLHWAQRNSLTQEWRRAAFVYGKGALAGRPPVAPPMVVAVGLPFRSDRRRDPHNYVGTVVKAIVDGLVDAGLFPDDTPQYVSVAEPTFIIGGQPVVTVKATPRSDGVER